MPGSDLTRQPDGTKLTYDDFANFPDDGMRHELIDGEHIVSPCPNTEHSPSRRAAEVRAVRADGSLGVHYVRTAELSLNRGDVLTSPLFPGLEMPLSIVFDLSEVGR